MTATFLLGPGFSVGIGNGLMLGYLMYRSALVPRAMAMLGLVAGPLLFASSILVLFGFYRATLRVGRHHGHPGVHLGVVAGHLADRQRLQAIADCVAVCTTSDERDPERGIAAFYAD